jgi:hypothetical protein
MLNSIANTKITQVINLFIGDEGSDVIIRIGFLQI